MVVRLKEWIIPYTGWDGIEISDNHVISVLLRAANNLIHVNGDRELYVDLQLEDWIKPSDSFPVWVTTGRILAEDWWEQTGTMLNVKTTSWDYFRFIMGNDGNLYLDPGNGVWTLIGNASGESINVKKFTVADLQDAVAWQAIIDWYLNGKYPIIVKNNVTYLLEERTAWNQLRFNSVHYNLVNLLNDGYSYGRVEQLYLNWDSDNLFNWWTSDEAATSPRVIATNIDYTTPYTPVYNGSPATKKYVDDWLAAKQNILTAWTGINISNNVISSTVQSMTYKWTVASQSVLPSTGNVNWDVRVAEDTGIAYIWNATNQSWDSLWNFVDLSNYFNLTTNTSDDIQEGTSHLFVTPTEKNKWNGKQDALTAGTWINITNNVISANGYQAWTWINIDNNNNISNTLPFNPENSGTVWQVIKKTSTGIRWADESGGGTSWVTSVNWRTGAVTVNEVPGSGTTGYVLKKTSNGYEWAAESWGGWGTTYTAWDGIDITNHVVSNKMWPSNPSAGNPWDVLYKSASWTFWGPNIPQIITDETNIWELAPGEYIIWLNAQTSDASPIKLNCKSTGAEEVGYFYAWYGSILTVAENYNQWVNLWLYYTMISWWRIHYGYANSTNGTYRKIFLHQNDPITLTCASNLDVDLNESLNYTLLLDQNCSLTFGQQSGHATFTPGCVYQFLIIQDSTGGHTLTLPNNFIYAWWNRTFPTTAGSICKLIVDYQDGNYFASITQYN